MKEEPNDDTTEDTAKDANAKHDYVDDLHPLYQKLRAAGHMDAILKMRHDPVQLEAAEKLAAATISGIAPMMEDVERIKEDPVALDKLKKAMASWAKTQS